MHTLIQRRSILLAKVEQHCMQWICNESTAFQNYHVFFRKHVYKYTRRTLESRATFRSKKPNSQTFATHYEKPYFPARRKKPYSSDIEPLFPTLKNSMLLSVTDFTIFYCLNHPLPEQKNSRVCFLFLLLSSLAFAILFFRASNWSFLVPAIA